MISYLLSASSSCVLYHRIDVSYIVGVSIVSHDRCVLQYIIGVSYLLECLFIVCLCTCLCRIMSCRIMSQNRCMILQMYSRCIIYYGEMSRNIQAIVPYIIYESCLPMYESCLIRYLEYDTRCRGTPYTRILGIVYHIMYLGGLYILCII